MPEKSLPKHESDFYSHLEELRSRIIVSAIVFFVASVFCFFFAKQILHFLIIPLQQRQEAILVFQKPYEAFLVHVQVSAWAGLVVALPVIFTQFWFFVAPGLYDREKKVIVLLAAASIFMFLIGAVFAYFVVVPWGIYFLLSFQTENLKPLLSIGPYFSFMTGMILSCGILFDFPLAIIGLVQLGVLRTETLSKSRKVIVVAVFVLAAVLTPSPDPLSQVALAIPLILLFESSLLIAREVEKRKAKDRP